METWKNMVDIQPYGDSQVLCGVLDDRARRSHFVDLRGVMDDKTVLRNPHKGWFWHYIDNGYGRGQYRDMHDESDALFDFPGLNHLYLRFDWGDVEKEKGVYDFSYLDEIMEMWGARGYRFSLRVCTFECSPEMNYTVPAYVYEEGAKCYRLPDGTVQPDYGDPIFLHYAEKFLYAMGEKYNGDPRIECVDIGTYGTWGEGHTEFAERRIYPIDVVKKHIDLHCKYFPDTFVLCNDDHIIGRMAKGDAEVRELLAYAKARGLGLQDDSICFDDYAKACGYDTLRAPWAFDCLAEYAPSVIEFCHYGYILPEYAKDFRDGLTMIEALKNSHATFAGFHEYPRKWLAKEYYLTEYCANRLGYWYFLTGAVLPDLTGTAYNIVELDVENRGWAKAYHKYKLKFRLTSEQGQYDIAVEADNRLWEPNRKQTLSCRLDCRNIPAGAYDICVGLFEGATPIRLALKEEIYRDGFYTLGKVLLS